MDAAALEVERAKAERKNPLLLWILNILWPGLGNLVIGQVMASMVIEIHQQESDVCSGVAASKAFVELDTVEDADSAVIKTDVLQMYVSVAFANEPVIHPLLEDVLMFSGECRHP